jgi:hypothetical protein
VRASEWYAGYGLAATDSEHGIAALIVANRIPCKAIASRLTFQDLGKVRPRGDISSQ